MKSRIINICAAIILAFMPFSLFAQDPAMYIYRTNGVVNGFLMSQVDSLSYSNIGLDSVEYDMPVVQQIWTKDGLYQVAISDIDSIGYYTPEPVFKPGLFIIDEKNVGQVADVNFKTMTISFLGNTPDGELPQNGQVIFCDLEDDPFPMGFSGRVTKVRNEGGKHVYECEVAGPEEVYDRLLIVGHVGSEGHQSNLPGKRPIKKGHWDGSYTIGTGSLFGPLDISGKGTISWDYTIDLNAFNSEPVYVWLKKKHEIEVDFKVNLVDDDNMVGGLISTNETGETVKEIWSEPIPLLSLARVLNLDLRLGCYFSYGSKFKVEASGLKWKYLDIEEYTRTGNDEPKQEFNYHEAGWNFDPKEDNIFDILKLKAELSGSVSFGLCAELAVDVWKPNWLALALGIKVGPELKGSFALDTDLLKADSPETEIYKFLSEDLKLTYGCKLGVDLKARAGKKEYTIAKATTTLFPKTVTLLPKLTKPALPKIYEFSPNQFMLDTYGAWDSNYGWNSGDPLAVSTIAKNQTLFPGYVGLSFYGENGQKIEEYYSDSGDWTWNWQYTFGKSIRYFSPQKIKVYPMYKILDIIPVKAEPSTITIPEPLSLSTHSAETKVGDRVTVTLNDGWGYYHWSSTSNIASIAVKEEDGVKYIEAIGVRPGNATVEVTDVRSGDKDSFELTVKSNGFELSTYYLTMNPNDVRTVTVFPQGDYQLKNSNSKIATAKILTSSNDRNSNVIEITAKKVGKCTITVSDTDAGDGGGSYISNSTTPGRNPTTPVLYAQNEHSLTFDVYVTNSYLKPGYLKVEPATINFGDVPAGGTRSKQFTISNTGDKELKFRIRNTCDVFDIPDYNGVTILEPNKSITFDVEFTPEKVDQEYECEVIIQTDASNGNQVLKLTGHGVEPSHAHVNVTPTVLDFGEVEINTSKTMQFTVSNTGESATNVIVSTPTSGVFRIPASNVDFMLFTGREKTFDVVFTPDEVGKEYECEVIISSEAENGNQTLKLKGKGKEYDDYVHGVCSGFTPEDGAIVDASSGYVHLDVHEFILPYSGANILEIRLNDNPSFVRGRCRSWNITWNGQKGDRFTGYQYYDFPVNPGTKYYWQVYYWDKDTENFEKCSPILTFTTTGEGGGEDDDNSYLTCPDDNHPHMINLGLPSGTKWACCNVDDEREQESPSNYGGYYAWGETIEKGDYSSGTYMYYDIASGTYRDIGSNIIGTENDVAHVKWGGSWQMPSSNQIVELRENCDHEWATVGGVMGLWFLGSNGGRIFIPASGYYSHDELENKNVRGSYWTGRSNSDNSAYEFGFSSSGVGDGSYKKYLGLPVRPVVK